MKKVLFVLDSIVCGGAERGLVALLNILDYSKYDVDLIYFCDENEYYKDQIPDSVNIIKPDLATKLALSSKSFVFRNLFSLRHLPLIVLRLFFGLLGVVQPKKYFRRRVRDWQTLKKFVPALLKEYDVAIGFIENSPVYYTIDKVHANRYIVWQRTDYKLTGCKPEWDLPYFEKADSICVLSEEMRRNFTSEFPRVKDRVIVFPNVMDIKVIQKKAEDPVDFDNSFDGYKIVSVGTLRAVKGYNVSVKACKRLADIGYDFKWYVFGSGEDHSRLQAEIESENLQDRFILMGNVMNPYPYIRLADVFVQCSYREGFSTTVFEAKCLLKPIVITDVPGMQNQIERGVNGLIAPAGDDKKIADEIGRLLSSNSLRATFSAVLQSQLVSYGNDTASKIELFDRIAEGNADK